MPLVYSDNEYVIKLAKGLFEYLIEEDLVVEFLARLNVPFGHSPEINLKWIRNYFQDEEEDMEEFEQNIEPVIESESLTAYDAQFYMVPSEGQYFFNHCVYGCLGELLDRLRPGGLTGLEPLQRSPMRLITDYEAISKNVLLELEDILTIRMGRTDFNISSEDPQSIAEKTYERMDEHLAREE